MPYRLRIIASAKSQMRAAPGNVRQRLRRVIEALAHAPRPPASRQLQTPSDLLVEVRRIRLHNWRIVYLVDEVNSAVGILAVRRRPPYDYSDLETLLEHFDR